MDKLRSFQTRASCARGIFPRFLPFMCQQFRHATPLLLRHSHRCPSKQYTETIGKCICIYVKIHGGGFNPFETVSQVENLPQIGAEHKKTL